MGVNDSTPPSAKRRKLSNDNSTNKTQSNARSSPVTVFSSLRNAVNGISKRLFESESNAQEDSADQTMEDIVPTPEERPVDLDGEAAQSTTTPKVTRRRSTRNIQKESVDTDMDGVEATPENGSVRASARQRKRPRRFSIDVEEPAPPKKTPAKATKTTTPAKKNTPAKTTASARSKTPAKTTTPRTRAQGSKPKEQEVEISDVRTESIGKELGFKDVDEGSAKRKTPASRAKKAQQPEDEPMLDALDTEDQPQLEPSPDKTKLTRPKKPTRTPKKVATKPKDRIMEINEEDIEQGELAVAEPEFLEPITVGDLPTLDQETDGVDVQTKRAFQQIQKIVLCRLTGRRRTPLVALDEEIKKVQHLAEQTVAAGEGNSLLIIGPRGSGKTTMIETVVSDLQTSHGKDFHVIRLNGFLQTDDRLALREIWRQLGRETDTEDDASKVSSYADTMASLLALLSQPEEMPASAETDTLAKSIIFIIDEFDLFATHPRQTLLYNLFDIAQSRKAPIAVFGLSTKVDVAEHLEKRVKSRFSHRYVYLSLAKNLPLFTDMCKSALLLHNEDLEHGDEHLSSAQQTWNSHIESLISTPSIVRHIRQQFTLTKSIPMLLSTFLLPLSQSQLLPTNLPTPESIISTSSTLLPPDSLLSSLPYLPPLTLSLLIAAARLDILLGTPQCNFNMAYHEYVSLCSRSRLQSSALGAVASASATRIWGRDVARSAWESLEEGGWIVGTGGEAKGGEGREERMYRVDIRLEEIDSACWDSLGRMERSWCREL